MNGIERAAAAIRDGDLVVYPTETVYGLGADAIDEAAVKRVFAAKGRDRSDPISLAVPTIDRALDYVEASDRELAFMREFLPGPVTVVVTKRSVVPDVLTGGRSRVGLRVPDHDVARALLETVAPLTATSANVSGSPSATTVDQLDPSIREKAAVVLDGGETGGTASTVVDVEAGVVHRAGSEAERVRTWLEARE
ncbi:MAG: L-threonylcarbamoyladenylate synthase [Halanaeroarchaeum sp.]